MSRYEKHNGNFELGFGHDHHCGWFVQVFDNSKDDETQPNEYQLVNLDDTPYTKGDCSAEVVKQVAEKYGFVLTDEELALAKTASPRETNGTFADLFKGLAKR